MISPYVKLSRGRHAGKQFKDLPDTYQTWLAQNCKHVAHRVKNCDIWIGQCNSFLSALSKDELSQLAKDDSITTWTLDLVLAHQNRPVPKWNALTALLCQ